MSTHLMYYSSYYIFICNYIESHYPPTHPHSLTQSLHSIYYIFIVDMYNVFNNTYKYSCPKLKCAFMCSDEYKMADRK